MAYRQQPISQKDAHRVLEMDPDEWRSHVEVSDGNPRASTLQGVEIEIEWSNPDCAIISHFWIDPKLRGEGIGKTMCREVLNQLQRIPRVEFVTTSIQAPDGATERVLKQSGFDEVVTYEHDDFDDEIAEGRIYF